MYEKKSGAVHHVLHRAQSIEDNCLKLERVIELILVNSLIN